MLQMEEFITLYFEASEEDREQISQLLDVGDDQPQPEAPEWH